jgi:hypothetical protein
MTAVAAARKEFHVVKTSDDGIYDHIIALLEQNAVTPLIGIAKIERQFSRKPYVSYTAFIDHAEDQVLSVFYDPTTKDGCNHLVIMLQDKSPKDTYVDRIEGLEALNKGACFNRGSGCCATVDMEDGSQVFVVGLDDGRGFLDNLKRVSIKPGKNAKKCRDGFVVTKFLNKLTLNADKQGNFVSFDDPFIEELMLAVNDIRGTVFRPSAPVVTMTT